MESTTGYGDIEGMVAKAQKGVCCLAGCAKKAEFESGGGFLDFPPVLCEEHLADPTPTHLGEWCLLEPRHRFEQWSCCQQGYKLTICSKYNINHMTPYTNTYIPCNHTIQTIPITTMHAHALPNAYYMLHTFM